MATRFCVNSRFSLLCTLAILLLAFSGPTLAQGAGDPVELTGEASVVIFDDFVNDRSETGYFIRDLARNKEVRLYFSNGAPREFVTGKQFKIRGRGRPDQGVNVEGLTAMADGDVAGGEAVAGAPVASSQERKVLTILVDFNDATVDGYKLDGVTPMKYGISPQEARDVMFNNPNNVSHFYDLASLGTLTIPEDTNGDGIQEVFGPYKIDDEYMTDLPSCTDNDANTTPNRGQSGCGCEPSTWVSKARAAWESANPSRSYTEYQHTLLIVPNYWDYPSPVGGTSRACGWGGVAQLYCGSNCWAIGADGDTIFHGVLIHELGHNFDMHHASTDPDNNNTINSEYGDGSDNMGGSRIWAKFNAVHAYDKGWYDPAAYEIQTVIPSGSAQQFDLLAMDEDVPAVEGLRAIKVQRDSGSDYFLSYRLAEGHYNGVPSAYQGKLNIHYGKNSKRSYYVTALSPGQTYNDPHNGLIITAVGEMDIGGGLKVMTAEVCQDTCAALPAPSGLTATANGTGAINLSWTDNASADGFTLEHSNNGSTWGEVIYSGSDLFYTHTGLTTASTHHYRVSAYLGSETSGWSNVAVETTDAIPPTAFFTWSADFTAVQFTDGSDDSDGSITSRSWNFGDGSTSSATNPSHTYASAGTYTVTLQVTDNHGATDTFVDPSVEVSEPPFSFHYALSELTAGGNTSGNYLDTYEDGGATESIRERESGGKPSNRYSWLEHQWNFSIPAGDLTTLLVKAWRDDNSEGDDFEFEYSANGSSWTPMFTVESSATNVTYSFNLTGKSGSIAVRVTDTDQSPGNRSLDSVQVDYMAIKVENASGGGSAPDTAPVLTQANPVGYDQVNLSWTDSNDDESGFRIERREINPIPGDWELAGQAGENATSFSDTGLSGATTYEYRVVAFNLYGDSPASNSRQALTGTPPPPAAIELSVRADKSKGKHQPYLTWTPAETAMDVYLDNTSSTPLDTGVSSGWTWITSNKGGATYTFIVCESGTATCSDPVTASY